MDFEFDLDEDKINSFLLNKLQEIKAKNNKLSLILSDRRQIMRGIMESCNIKTDESNIKLSPQVWKKIFNGKYILGITIENNGSSSLKNLKPILKWDSPLPLTYQVLLYEECVTTFINRLSNPIFICNKNGCNGITNTISKSNEVNKLAHLFVVLKQPDFINSLSYNISGNLIFQQDECNKALIFPTIELSAFDATILSLHNFTLSTGDVRDILMATSGSEETKLLMILPQDWSNSFDSTLEILCSFTKINMERGCRKLFVAHRLSPCIDDSVLIFHAPTERNVHIYNVAIYTRNEESLLSLLHHLHQNIPGVLIIPETLYENYIQDHPERISVESETSDLRSCILREIYFMSSSLNQLQFGRSLDSISKFYSELLNIENDTNLHYLRLVKSLD